ncbi:conserved hypothetical protein [Candidatus Nitrotoga sp. HW29]|uniref:hypothetical protein n=1 Tax=Candidatus Nitrotoga sp. HW29 TaxID=2886963 RepID=UPI001EF28B8B|nr:hypothetical protein [Candidatus Nitrotoga sp. HW29]CAH1904481.1 conserved hypothetical protein [Candidatus Nitrotoga sp. HW29]
MYFYQALITEGGQKNRDVLWGKLFQSIGQVIHHVQDMAQPQHVRNDQHVDKFIPGYVNPSLYEKYTSNQQTRPEVQALFSLPGSEPVYSGTHPGAFKIPRDFWKNTQETGLAEFTNHNFVSDGTNFKLYQGQPVVGATYGLPVPYGSPQNVPASELLPPLSQDILTSCSVNQVSVCTMSFYASNGPNVVNPRASALSIFDQYVQLKLLEFGDPFNYKTDRLFTLNRYTFNAAHSLLIPKAVGYSAGLINYFFRGKMEISLPDEGIYGIIDHSDPVSNQQDTGGFRKIKLKLKNVTPNGTGIELMAATGKLIAVAKFHRNTCYTPSLSGEYGSPGIDWRTCRAKDEEIVVSEVIETTPIGINTDATQLTFNFNTPIPINASDLYLQAVYTGPLGAETNAVAVVTKDISEPHYIYSSVATWDQATFRTISSYPQISGPGGQSWESWCATGFPTLDACNQGMGYINLVRYSGKSGPISGYDPSDPIFLTGTIYDLSEAPPFPPVATMPDPLGPAATVPAPVGSFSRVAVLTDAQPSNTALSLEEKIDTTHGIALFQWFTGVAATTINQRDPTNDTLTPTAIYLPARGIYVRAATAPALMSGTAPQPFPDLKILPSQINF